MPNFAIIKAHKVANVIVADEGFAIPNTTLVVVPDGLPVSVGWAYNNATFTAPAQDPDPVPPMISDRQFGEGLWHAGIITFEECEAFVSVGAIPTALQAIVDTLPDDETGEPTPRKVATILIKGAKEYRRADPLVDIVRQGYGWSVAVLDDHWRTWATL